jgi:hypothetical protein
MQPARNPMAGILGLIDVDLIHGALHRGAARQIAPTSTRPAPMRCLQRCRRPHVGVAA